MLTPLLAATNASSWILESLIYSFSYNSVIGSSVLIFSFILAYVILVMTWGKLWNKKWKPAKAASQNLFFLILSLVLSLCMVSLTAYWDAANHEIEAFTAENTKSESSAKSSGWGNTTQTNDSNKEETKSNNNASSSEVKSMIDTMRNKAEGDISKDSYDSGRTFLHTLLGSLCAIIMIFTAFLSSRSLSVYPISSTKK